MFGCSGWKSSVITACVSSCKTSEHTLHCSTLCCVNCEGGVIPPRRLSARLLFWRGVLLLEWLFSGRQRTHYPRYNKWGIAPLFKFHIWCVAVSDFCRLAVLQTPLPLSQTLPPQNTPTVNSWDFLWQSISKPECLSCALTTQTPGAFWEYTGWVSCVSDGL